MRIESIARQSTLVDTVVDRIRGEIENGGINPGDRLPNEFDLATRFGVSRTVIREAVRRLDSIGLLTVRRGQGIFVGDQGSLCSCIRLVRTAMAISPSELKQYTELRSAIECHAIREAARRATPEDVTELQSLCDMIVEFEASNVGKALDGDIRFHMKLVRMSDNEVMSNVLEVVREFMTESMRRTFPKMWERPFSRRLHQNIVDAIKAGDPVKSEQAMKQHMDEILKRLEKAPSREEVKKKVNGKASL